jgi:hypothetical protein
LVRFYLDVLGLSGCSVVEEEHGVVLAFDDGFRFALLRGEPSSPSPSVHFGCALGSGDEVRATRSRLRAAGVRELEFVEEPDLVSVKVADPDGYVVEVYWE